MLSNCLLVAMDIHFSLDYATQNFLKRIFQEWEIKVVVTWQCVFECPT